MTRAEFDAWIEEHYEQLIAVARRRVRTGYEDVAHTAIARMLASPELAVRPVSMAWPWAVGAVRSVAANARRSADRQKEALRTEKIIRHAGALHIQEDLK